ncbi:MAG: hypothetical protein ACOX2R_12445 [Anaerolineae bacterium]
MDELLPYVVHTHAKDAKGQEEVPLGQGDVDFDWYIPQIRSQGF